MKKRKDETPQSQSDIMNRRQFLLKTRDALGAVGIAYLTNGLKVPNGERTNDEKPSSRVETDSNPVEANEVLSPLTAEALVLDIFEFDRFKQRVFEQYFTQTGFSEEQMLTQMQIEDSSDLNQLLRAEPGTTQEELLLLLEATELYFGKHGEHVSYAREAADTYFKGDPKEYDQVSLVDAIAVDKITHDDDGNPTMWLHVSPAMVSQYIKESDRGVVNLSFEVGTIGVTFESKKLQLKYPDTKYLPIMRKRTRKDAAGNLEEYVVYLDGKTSDEITKDEYDQILAQANEREIVSLDPIDRQLFFEDGYQGEHTYNNLKALAGVARNNTEKIIVAATGNPEQFQLESFPDITDAKERLLQEELWPDNLIMAAVWGMDSGQEGQNAYGADFYVDHRLLDELELPMASSFATAILSELVGQLVDKGFGKEDIKDELFRLSENKGTEEYPCMVLSSEKIKALLHAPEETAD